MSLNSWNKICEFIIISDSHVAQHFRVRWIPSRTGKTVLPTTGAMKQFVRVVGGGYRQLFYTKIYFLPLLFYDDYFFLVRSTDKKNYKGAKWRNRFPLFYVALFTVELTQIFSFASCCTSPRLSSSFFWGGCMYRGRMRCPLSLFVSCGPWKK